MVGHRIHPYDRDALNKEPRTRRLECAKCKFIARDPVVALSCNHMFCLSCFENMHQNANAICPVDGKDVSQGSYADIAVQQEIHSLVVHCTFMDVGCIWKGQLRYLQIHLNENHNNCEREAVSEGPCLEPEHPPDQTSPNEQMCKLVGIAEHSGVNVRTEGHDSAHEDCRPQCAGVAEAAENMQAQQPSFDFSREGFEKLNMQHEEMRAQLVAFNFALNVESQACKQQVPCLEPERPPDHTFLNEQMFNLAGIAEHSGVNVRTEGHDSAHEDCRPQGAGVAEAAENMQAQQPTFDVSREEFERLKRRLEEMRAQLNYALNIEQQAREQEVVVQRNRCDCYRDEYVAELQRVCDEMMRET
ncbi:uncharacterized protein [Montipora capricornis]|uniref:uncharacterized protein n=1 Tax=Montipora capricornis TaxID=246305 RepID=UPI0035F13E8F